MIANKEFPCQFCSYSLLLSGMDLARGRGTSSNAECFFAILGISLPGKEFLAKKLWLRCLTCPGLLAQSDRRKVHSRKKDLSLTSIFRYKVYAETLGKETMKMRIALLRLLALTVLSTIMILAGSVLRPHAATAATFYVAKTGSDSNTCTQAQVVSTPKLTVRAGIACMAGGDTLRIRAGTYAETATTPPSVTSWSNPTTIAINGTDVVVFGTPNPLLTFNTSLQYLIVDGIIFDAISGTGN